MCKKKIWDTLNHVNPILGDVCTIILKSICFIVSINFQCLIHLFGPLIIDELFFGSINAFVSMNNLEIITTLIGIEAINFIFCILWVCSGLFPCSTIVRKF